jgi:hypothetical protein
MICYIKDIDIYKRYLNYLIENDIFIHQTKDYFGNTPFEIIGENQLWINEIISYYNSFA